MEIKSKKIDPPADFGAEAREEWHRICEELESVNQLERIDRAMLTIYCQVWAINREASIHCAQNGTTIEYANGIPGQSPQYKTAKETASQIHRMLAEMGLTPAVRMKIQKGKEPDGDDDQQELKF